MSRNASRPLSPHLSIWRWGPHMAVSILHRVTGGALSVAGMLALVWWLTAAAAGAEAYDYFVGWARSPLGVFVAIGLTWTLFQHTASGLRHLVMDTGSGFELATNKFWANMTIIGSVLLTALTWLYILGVR
jgi:succinate dehydrogenase / fumarate reductase cytochrome b subunit